MRHDNSHHLLAALVLRCRALPGSAWSDARIPQRKTRDHSSGPRPPTKSSNASRHIFNGYGAGP
jgi:hypothetical protein